MAELTHFYDEENAVGTTTSVALSNTMGAGSNPAQILGSALAANTKYLIAARALWGVDSATNKGNVRVKTDDSTIQVQSLAVVEFEQTSSDEYFSYFFAQSFITDSSPGNVEIQASVNASSTLSIDQSSLFLLDLDAFNLINLYRFDASDAGPTDSAGDWNNDANAFDSSRTSFADKVASGGGVLSGEGTTAPTSGATIGLVTVRVTHSAWLTSTPLTVTVDEDSVGGTTLGTAVLHQGGSGGGGERIGEFSLSAPSGGWTWQKVNDLAISFSGTSTDGKMAYAEVAVFGAGGRGYFEDIQPDSGDDLSKTPDTTVMASLAGSDLGTDEHLILGYGRCDIANTGRYFDISLHAAYDTSTSTVRSQHRAEGEDVNEQRIVGFALRHKASSGTPDVTMFGASENAGGGQNADGGGYLIALPTALFADFEDDFTSGFINVDGTETTVATSGSYTPTVTGNHLIIGRTNGSAGPTALGRMWVDSTTTEIRTGDEPPSHNQIWDNTKDLEMMATFQRYSITTAETFNLQVQGAASNFGVAFRWLIVVNLNKPATGPTVYPPFPQRQRRAVRM